MRAITLRTVGNKRNDQTTLPTGAPRQPWITLFHSRCNAEIHNSQPACISAGETHKSIVFIQFPVSHFQTKKLDQSKKPLNHWWNSSTIQIRTLPNPHGWPIGCAPSSSPRWCTWADPVGWSCRNGPINKHQNKRTDRRLRPKSSP